MDSHQVEGQQGCASATSKYLHMVSRPGAIARGRPPGNAMNSHCRTTVLSPKTSFRPSTESRKADGTAVGFGLENHVHDCCGLGRAVVDLRLHAAQVTCAAGDVDMLRAQHGRARGWCGRRTGMNLVPVRWNLQSRLHHARHAREGRCAALRRRSLARGRRRRAAGSRSRETTGTGARRLDERPPSRRPCVGGLGPGAASVRPSAAAARQTRRRRHAACRRHARSRHGTRSISPAGPAGPRSRRVPSCSG